MKTSLQKTIATNLLQWRMHNITRAPAQAAKPEPRNEASNRADRPTINRHVRKDEGFVRVSDAFSHAKLLL